MKTLLKILALIGLIIVAVILLTAAKALAPKHADTNMATTTDTLIQVSFPKAGDTITSPLKVTGQARGNWYFEASFPIVVVDWDGLIIGQGHAEAKGNWMTTDFVPFEGTIEFTKPACAANVDYCKRGAVIFKNDNPSGDPAKDKAVEISVKFQ